MKYPQGYIFLSEKAQLPPLSTIQAWCGAGTEIYVKGLSPVKKLLDDRIELLEELHRFAFKKPDYHIQCVAFSGTAVNHTFLIANSGNVLKVYWIDTPEQARKLKQVFKPIQMTTELTHCFDEVERIYSAVSEHIHEHSGQTLVGDSDIQRFFMGRAWGTTTEAEIHVRKIAKDVTRAGILRRFDLEGEQVTA